MTPVRPTIGFYLTRALIYLLLTAFGLFMLFPFIYMVSTSLKVSSDVFNYPPRLLPYSPQQVVGPDGTLQTVYLIEVNGQERQMILTGDKTPHIFFTTEDRINVEAVRTSEIVLAMARDAVDAGGAVATGSVITRTAADGSTETFDEYTVQVDGQPQTLLEAYRGSLDEFSAVDDLSVTVYAVERNANKLEFVDFQVSNYNAVFQLNLDRALVNTMLVTFFVVSGQLVTSILGGYAFSRVSFRGRDTLFLFYLGSIMIPFVVLIIPMYRLMVVMDWQNKLVSLIIPWIFTAYGTFLMRQFFLSIPKEIEEAALLDGASRFRILWAIFVPLSTPAIATLAIFSFLYAWNSFLWPLLIIGEGTEKNHVLTLSLIRLSNSYADQPNLVLTGAAVAILPPVLVFIFAQRYFIEGVASAGVKG